MVRIRLLPGSRALDQLWAHDEVMWGIPRRHGYSDIEDPRAHSGITQHAFPMDKNDRAICGNEPQKRATSLNPVPLPQLALASPIYNPRCGDCQKLLTGASRHAGPARDLDTLVAIPIEADPKIAAIPITIPVRPLPMKGVAVGDPLVPIILPGPATQWTNPRTTDAMRETPKQPTRRRSVRRGGTATVAPGELSVEIQSPQTIAGAGIVASVVRGPTTIRVVSVTVHGDGRATIVLNKAPESSVTLTWFIVSATEPPPVSV